MLQDVLTLALLAQLTSPSVRHVVTCGGEVAVDITRTMFGQLSNRPELTLSLYSPSLRTDSHIFRTDFRTDFRICFAIPPSQLGCQVDEPRVSPTGPFVLWKRVR